MKKFIYTLLFIISVISVFSQTEDAVNFLKSADYTFSYYGNNLVNPGFKSSINFTISSKTNTIIKTKKSGKKVDKSNKIQFLTSGNIGFYWQPESHIGTFNYYEIIRRKIKLKDNSYSFFGAGPGIYRSVFPETYEIDDNGNIERHILAGRTYFAPVFTFGSGRFKNNNFLNSLTFSTDIMFLFNYNSGIVPLINLEIGFNFNNHKK